MAISGAQTGAVLMSLWASFAEMAANLSTSLVASLRVQNSPTDPPIVLALFALPPLRG